MALTGQTKSSATTLTPPSKTSVTISGIRKAGAGWAYNESGITYDGEFDAEGRKVLYDSIGTQAVFTPQTKNAI
jgi:hypothetical protein